MECQIRWSLGDEVYGGWRETPDSSYLSLDHASHTNLQSFDVDLYMYMSWRDPRLNHSEKEYILVNDDALRKELW